MSGLSRRSFLQSNAVLLAALGVPAALPAAAEAQQATDLARYRPVTVSSTAYAPTPAWFAVDGLAETGVKGSGWRAGAGDPQWIAVDLQAACRIESVVLVFEATAADPVFTPASGINPFLNTTGWEVLSSCAVAFSLDVSADGRTWQGVHTATDSPGGRVEVTLAKPVTARWVRLTAKQQANANPVGVNAFEVYGRSDHPRPDATGWTDWGRHTTRPPALATAADGTVALESGWTLTMDSRLPSADGATLARAGVDTSTWLPATVPGTVHTSLVERGKLPEPTSGFGNMRAPEALSRHSWWYRREFTLPRGFDAGRRVWLEFDGIDHHAEVWVDGTAVGSLTHPVARAAFDVTTALRGKDAHALAVRIDPMPHPGNPGDKGPDGVSTLNSNAEQQDLPGYISISGWDWMPGVRDRGAGIWNHVRLRSTGDAVLGEPRVDTRLPNLPDTSVAEVTLVVPVRNASSTARTVTIAAELAGARVSRRVTLAAGASTDVTFSPATDPALRLRRPELWWPNGYGDPNLYDLTLTAAIGASTSDRRTTKIGLRQIGYRYDLPIVIADGRATQSVDLGPRNARYVRMQGLKRATGWGFSLWTMSVVDSAAPDTDLAKGKTATSLSVADGNPPENAVDGDPDTRWTSAYDDNQWLQVDLGAATAFDKVVLTWETAYAATFTIQVSDDGQTWTDAVSVDNSPKPLTFLVNGVKVFARGGSWGWDELLRRMPQERTDAVVAMHRDMNFTLIRNWVGSSYRQELFDACDKYGILLWNEFWDGWSTDPANHDIFLAQAKDTVLRYRHHACATVWFGCNEGTPPAVIDNALREIVTTNTDLLYQGNSAGGVITGDGPYRWLDPKQYFTGEATGGKHGFWSEIGLPTVSVVESMRNLVGEGDAGWPIGAPWFLHDWSTNGNQSPQTYLAAIDARLAPSTSLAEFCRKAQFVNYESMRAIFEAWNTKLWADATGVLLWMSHPAWHSTVWQTYDYDLDVNGSYYGARKGCEAYHVQADLSTWQVRVVNHTPSALSGVTASARLYGLDGAPLGATRQQKVDVAPIEATDTFTVPFDAGLPDLHLLRLSLTDAHGAVLSENTYWRYRTDAAMRALNQLPGAQLTTSLRPDGTGYVATVRNTGRTVAAMIRLSLREKNGKDRVLPTRYDDNYFWLLPGESRTIRVDPTRRVPQARLQVEAYNVAAKLI